MRAAGLAFVLLSLASSAFAVDPGKAEGSLTVNATRIDLAYAYAIGHQKDEITKRSDEVKVVLTDKPLPDSVKINDLDLNFPEGVLGLIVSITADDKVSHVIVQHPTGTYDSGYTEEGREYRFKTKGSDRGTISGNVSSRRVQTNTMTFAFDVEFAATVK
ncbi:MAG TPA: hypothetical protein VIO12_07665 [Thermoanaerobaculia bacterium]